MSTCSRAEASFRPETWNLDPFTPRSGFAVDYMVGTFRGSFSPVEARLEVTEDGSASLTGSAPVDGRQGAGREPRSASASRPTSSTPSARRRSRSARARSAVDGDEVTVAGDLTIKGTSLPVTRDAARSASRPTYGEASVFGAHARGPGRPHAVRPELEQPAPERQAGAGERRDADRRAVLREGVDDEGPRQSPAACAATRTTRKLAASPRPSSLPQDVELEIWDGLKAVPPYDEDDDGGTAPAAVARMRAAIAGADARAVRDARVQLVGPRPAQERARLGVAAGGRRTRCATSRWQWSAPARARSARCGRRPSCARCLPRRARAWSTARSPSGTPTSALTPRVRSSM